MLEKAPRSSFALGCFFHFTGTVIANTLRHTTKVAGCSYVCVMVELTGIEPVSENKSVRFSPGAGYALHSLCQNFIAKAMTSVVSDAWRRPRRSVTHVHH